jgi:hypothetical protein
LAGSYCYCCGEGSEGADIESGWRARRSLGSGRRCGVMNGEKEWLGGRRLLSFAKQDVGSVFFKNDPGRWLGCVGVGSAVDSHHHVLLLCVCVARTEASLATLASHQMVVGGIQAPNA